MAFQRSRPAQAAWTAFDERFRVSARRHVQPSFNEIREILNLAQVMAYGLDGGALRWAGRKR